MRTAESVGRDPLPRFIPIEKLGAGHRIRIEGKPETVAKVERSADQYHWLVHLIGFKHPLVFPPGGRFTNVNAN